MLRSCIRLWQDTISLDEDLIANSERSLETLVQLGQTLGVAKGGATTLATSRVLLSLVRSSLLLLSPIDAGGF